MLIHQQHRLSYVFCYDGTDLVLLLLNRAPQGMPSYSLKQCSYLGLPRWEPARQIYDPLACLQNQNTLERHNWSKFAPDVLRQLLAASPNCHLRLTMPVSFAAAYIPRFSLQGCGRESCVTSPLSATQSLECAPTDIAAQKRTRFPQPAPSYRLFEDWR